MSRLRAKTSRATAFTNGRSQTFQIQFQRTSIQIHVNAGNYFRIGGANALGTSSGTAYRRHYLHIWQGPKLQHFNLILSYETPETASGSRAVPEAETLIATRRVYRASKLASRVLHCVSLEIPRHLLHIIPVRPNQLSQVLVLRVRHAPSLCQLCLLSPFLKCYSFPDR